MAFPLAIRSRVDDEALSTLKCTIFVHKNRQVSDRAMPEPLSWRRTVLFRRIVLATNVGFRLPPTLTAGSAVLHSRL
jgi:hypothetical protein